MDAVRYYIALVILIGFPAGMSMWFVIHPLARFWRRRGPFVTYLAVVAVAALIAGTLFRFRAHLLRIEYGFGWAQAIGSMVCLAASIVLEHHYRRQLVIATLLGVPEVSRTRPSPLLTEGIYSRVRHPRYLGLLLELFGAALLANYLAGYVVAVAAIPVVYLTVLLEERELRERFGEEYERYRRRVPAFLPRIGPLRRRPRRAGRDPGQLAQSGGRGGRSASSAAKEAGRSAARKPSRTEPRNAAPP